jgi:hypothetical protein
MEIKNLFDKQKVEKFFWTLDKMNKQQRETFVNRTINKWLLGKFIILIDENKSRKDYYFIAGFDVLQSVGTWVCLPDAKQPLKDGSSWKYFSEHEISNLVGEFISKDKWEEILKLFVI